MNEDQATKIKALMKMGAYIYIAQPNTKYNKEEGGHKNSFNHWEDLEEWLAWHPQYEGGNIGIDLDRSPFVVVDVDQHSANGLQSLKDYLKRQQVSPEVISATYLEKTAGGGWHVFYTDTANQSKTRQINAVDGLDVLNSGGVIVSPSVIDGNDYKAVTDLNTIQERPNWVDKIGQTQTSKHLGNRQAKYSIAERWNMVANGFTTGQRNDQATSLIGWVLSSHVAPAVAFNVAMAVNQQSPEPLSYGELEKVYMSVLKREIKRAKNRGRVIGD
ncbi:bifunctional DNA primase/polymerase [Fructobacillus ficulneus]|uniref:Prophage Lp3 protein 7 n=1 Tax=Fructobacillus ficulneus TaxID=157463 RepID=A0A0K8MFF2_9LACO|nr:bifunctional DNA primase/polymerase [Fructobacillus ficulneus]GAO99217.1 prophage Lp3 protein 7 [Fructobacillus ficulneus]